MTRRGNVLRLPVPPEMAATITSAPDDIKKLHEHINTMTTILNQGLQSLQNRINTVQQVTAKAPPNVSGFTVTGKQGLFHLTWNRINNVDGYVITQASDTGMVQLVGRFNISDGQQCTYQVPVGNVAVTNSFQIYAYQGNKYGDPSPAITATTAVYASAEAAPPAPPIAPLQPKKAPVRSGPNLP
jgi:hypothetical protein